MPRPTAVQRAGRGVVMPQQLASLSTGRAIFLLDLLALALLWPAALLLMGCGSMAFAVLYPAANLGALYALGLYRRDVALEVRRSLGRVPLAAAAGALGAGVALAALGLPGGGVVPAVRAAGCFLLTGALARVLFDVLRRRGLFCRALLVVGAGRRAWDLVWMLRKEGLYLNYRIMFVHSPELGEVDPRLADGCWGTIEALPQDSFLGAAQRFGADSIVVAPDERRGLKLEGLLDCKIAGIPVLQYLSFIEKETRRVDMKRMELSWLLYSDGFVFGALDRVLKRTMDLLVSVTVLLLASLRWGGRRAAALVCAGLILASPVFRMTAAMTHAPWFDHREGVVLPGRMDSLFAGALVAICAGSVRFERAYNRFAPFAWVAPVFFAVVSPVLRVAGGNGYTYTAGYTLESLAAAFSLAWLLRNPHARTSRALGWRPVAVLGLASYSGYLYQSAILFLWPAALGGRHPALVLLIAAAAGLLAYLLVEVPVERLRGGGSVRVMRTTAAAPPDLAVKSA